MEKTAWQLGAEGDFENRNSKFENSDPSKKQKLLEVQVLTGKRYWYQTAFCLHSLQRVAEREVVPVIHDDGTLQKEHAKLFQRICRGAKIDWLTDIDQRIDQVLPRTRFPFLRQRRDEMPLIRKITDIHAGREGWRLFLDADLLFFRKPEFLLNWWDRPDRSIHAVDVVSAYGYPLEVLAQLCGRPVLERVNTGITGLKSDEINWDRLEEWCRVLTEEYRPHYYQEQALVALHLSSKQREAAPAGDYVTLPNPPEATECQAVSHHYVDLSKKWYYRNNWRRVFSSEATDSPIKPESILKTLEKQRRRYPQIVGQTKTLLYRKPKEKFQKMIRLGVLNYWKMPSWAGQMEKAAEQLRPQKADEGKPTRQVWFLSGRNHWYQTAFCAWTFQRWSRFRVVPVIVDDGTFDEEVQAKFARIFPEHLLWRKEDCNRCFAEEFPVQRYPMIHAVRGRQVLFRKMTKVFGRVDEWRFLMDSDMLFFSEPREIDDLLEHGRDVFVQKDCWETYGYSRVLLERLAGRPLPEAVNIGIVHYKGSMIDWDKIESWLTELILQEGLAYNITQGIFAVALSGKDIRFLKKERYRVFPKNPAPEEPLPTCGHYVADSKPWYFGQGWKKALELAGA